jgi:uncharacterized OB-fold protein
MKEQAATTVGSLYTFTKVYVGPQDIEVPYVLGWIDLEDPKETGVKKRVFARVIGSPALGVSGSLTWIEGEGWWFKCAE